MSCAKLEVKHRLTPVEKEDMLTSEEKIELVTPNPSPRVDPFTVCGPRGMTTARRRLPELLFASAEMRLGVRLRVRHRRFWHSGVVYLFCLGYREVGIFCANSFAFAANCQVFQYHDRRPSLCKRTLDYAIASDAG